MRLKIAVLASGLLITAFSPPNSAHAQSHSNPAPALTAASPALSPALIESTAQNAIAAFDTPGMVAGIVHNGQVIYSGGVGQRDIVSGAPVNAQTLFRIASTTKAFTSAALAILVDDGVLDWDDKVIDYLPGFQMSDPWVTQEFTIRDLLTHRSGLGLGAGDLMLWPEPSGFSRAELIHNLRYLKPVSSFRSAYAYDNLLYIVAGEVAAAAADTSWENLVQTRILDPLEMQCYAGDVPRSKRNQTAIPYGLIDKKMTEVTRNRIENASNISAAAGGLVCNVDGMNRWMLTQLAGGVGPNGYRIFSEKQRDEMWTSQTILSVSDLEHKLDRTHFKTYALGWRKEDMHGYEVISHTGTLSGFQAYVTLVPELDLGVIILNNGSNSGARNALMQTVVKIYMNQPSVDWVKFNVDEQAKRKAEQKTQHEASNDNHQGTGTVSQPIENYVGVYEDPWFGKVDIIQSGAALRFSSREMIKMVGTMTPFDLNTFKVMWDDREFRADAYMQFETDGDGRVSGATIRHIDPDGDWSFDFQDLNFTRVSN
ncbi:serine hydrolase [Robiginitomaculum antarcticum]|uniref:serine hydrolase n=1 Tax=Robiginitomaculum antarcticum TaxID=437507 RepID=UPI00037D9EE5|nr:serine hydrolase [Robiginitomaculum antarcticum]